MAQHLVWTGTRLLVWSDWRQTLGSDAATLTNGERGVETETRDGLDVWAYDPAADRWAALVWGGRSWPTPAVHTGMIFTPAGS